MKGEGDSKVSTMLSRCIHRTEKHLPVTSIGWAVMIKEHGPLITTHKMFFARQQNLLLQECKRTYSHKYMHMHLDARHLQVRYL